MLAESLKITVCVIHFESNGNNHLQVIMICFSLHLTRALCLNYSEFPNSCRLIQFAVSIYFFDMLVDYRQSNIIKCSHHLLRQLYILILITHFKIVLLVTDRINIGQIFCCAGTDCYFIFFLFQIGFPPSIRI